MGIQEIIREKYSKEYKDTKLNKIPHNCHKTAKPINNGAQR